MLQDWQVIDENHAHCEKCMQVFAHTDLPDGLCDKCLKPEAERREHLVSTAESRTLSKGVKAAANLLSSIKKQGKSGASMPVAMSSFYEAVGGETEFGKLMFQEFQRARGEDLSIIDEETFEYSPKLVLQWIDMLSRHTAKSDEGKQLDVSSLESADLESLLSELSLSQLQTDPALRQTVLYAAIKQDPKFRKLAFEEAIAEEPGLVDELLRKHGIDTIDAPRNKKNLTHNNNIEEASFSDENYDPSEDEYQKGDADEG